MATLNYNAFQKEDMTEEELSGVVIPMMEDRAGRYAKIKDEWLSCKGSFLELYHKLKQNEEMFTYKSDESGDREKKIKKMFEAVNGADYTAVKNKIEQNVQTYESAQKFYFNLCGACRNEIAKNARIKAETANSEDEEDVEFLYYIHGNEVGSRRY